MGKKNNKVTPAGNAVAGALAGMFAVTMSYPFDLTKTRMQFAVGAGEPAGFVHIAKTIFREGHATGGSVKGFLSFYRGLDQLMPEAAFKTMLRFFIFKELNDAYMKLNDLKEMTVAGNLLCGATAGAVETTLVVQPFERGKTLRADFQNPYKVYGDLYKSRGIGAAISSIYRGYLPCLGRQVGNQATAFTVFYGLKAQILKNRPDGHLGVAESMGLGFMSGAMACCVTMPMDVAKSIAQKATDPTKVKGTVAIMQDIVRSKGLKGLYVGLGPRIGRVGLDRAFGFLAFEWISEKMAGMDSFRAQPASV